MSSRKGKTREEPLAQVRAQKQEHAKHSEHFSKKRTERFSVQGYRAPQSRKSDRGA